MRLLKCDERGEISLTKDLSNEEIPQYAILSHTWGEDEDEITFRELKEGPNKSKPGYKKLQLCVEQAKRDELNYSWVDTCCIDKTSTSDVSENINSMFRYYQKSTKCYVYLSDVDETSWETGFGQSRWFRRGWTLQELLAPKNVEFFSQRWEFLGNKTELEDKIHAVTKIRLDVLRSTNLSQISKEERMGWMTDRKTKKEEDMVYCLLGIFGVSMSVRYGEGESEALVRLEAKIKKKLRPTIQDIDSRIKDYYCSHGRLDIERLSGQSLPMETCFINLSIIDRPRDNGDDTDNVDRESFPFNLAARLRIDTPKQSTTITLKSLFQPRNLARGTTGQPKRVVIWGRAGMGKTTLCKKIVHDFIHQNLWHGLYDRVFWLPLRRLILLPNELKSVAELIHGMCFPDAADDSLTAELLRDAAQDLSARCLFILDGLDEVSRTIDHDSPMGANLHKLLTQENVIVTSRPHISGLLKRSQPDLELETIGFFPEQTEEFLGREIDQQTMSRDTVLAIQAFIRSRPVVRSLVQIPIQLDAICYTWDVANLQEDDVTMTLLYQAIVRCLWQKDIVRTHRKFNGQAITSQQIQSGTSIELLIEPESSCLQELAFAGLYNQLVEFNSDNINAIAGGREPLLDSRLCKLSFLRSSERTLKSVCQTHHFLHLTFQEYFAAQYFVRHWSSNEVMVFPKVISANTQILKDLQRISPNTFMQHEKYNPCYDIFWRFVAGLVQMELGDGGLNRFFEEIEAEPYDSLGVVHQLLTVRCLNEVLADKGTFSTKAQELEYEYRKWTFFASEDWNSQNLLELAECPDTVLRYWLEGSEDEKIEATKALIGRSNMPLELLLVLVEEARKTENTDLRRYALTVIAMHCDQLPEETVTSLFTAQNIDAWSQMFRGAEDGQVMGHLVLERTVQFLQDRDPRIRHAAIDALRFQHNLSESTIEALCQLLLSHQDSQVQCGAADALKYQETLLDSAIDALVQLLINTDKDSDVRRAVANTLELQKILPEFAIKAIVQLLQDKDPYGQYVAAIALSSQKSLPDFAVRALIKASSNQHYDIQRATISALRSRTTFTECTVEAIVQLLQDQDIHVRRAAANALGCQTSLPEFAIEAVIQLLQDQDSNTRCSAAHTLAWQTSLRESDFEIIIQLLQDSDSDVRYTITDALAHQESLPESVLRALIQVMEDQHCDIREEAVWAIGSQKSLPEYAVEILIQALQNQDPDVRYAAAYCLNHQSRSSVVPVQSLIRLLKPARSAAHAMYVLEERADFYELITDLDSVSLVGVLDYWITHCLIHKRHIYAVFKENTFIVEVGWRQWTIPLKKGEREGFERRWLEVKEAIGIPLTHNELKVLSKPLSSKPSKVRRQWMKVLSRNVFKRGNARQSK